MEKKLSIIVPCYNEGEYVYTVLHKIVETKLPADVRKEIIIINDGSTDNTYSEIEKFKCRHSNIDIKAFSLSSNSGKGTCITKGIEIASGDYILIQDSDLEYDPRDYNRMIPLLLEDRADVVYGSRFRGSEPHRVLFFMHTIGNKLLTFLSNIFTQLNLTDMECGYKMFRAEIVKKIKLKEKRFGFEPEITAKISRIKNIRIYEVGISYYGRTYVEGKKINWQDGFRALYCILKYNLFDKQ